MTIDWIEESIVVGWLGVERRCVEADGELDNEVRRMATIVNTSQNPLTYFRFLGLCPLNNGTVSLQLPLYLCHYCPPREYVF